MYKNLLLNLSVAWEALLANKIRAALTTLGIIFGVAAVIAMLAIGNGAQKEILEQIKLVGLNNIVIESVVPKLEEDTEDNSVLGVDAKKENLSDGLSLSDAHSIQQFVPTVVSVSPEIVIDTKVIKDGFQQNARLIGVETVYFQLSNFKLVEGTWFQKQHLEHGDQVCIIGRNIASKFFSKENPIGKSIKCGKHWLKVIGVLAPRTITENNQQNLGIRDFNQDVYAPVKTVLTRFRNRGQITKAKIQYTNSQRRDNDKNKVPENYHQLDRLVVQVEDASTLSDTAEIIARMLRRRHIGEVDYEIRIPELLVKQQQRTNAIFNWVLLIIACISLLVGGIGIMNIMLASVWERIKEIGLRMAIGAQRRDIVLQFLFESMLISLTGGLIGIILGIIMAFSISQIANIPTIISFASVFWAFLISASVGLIFGIMPARRAARQNPISSLRHE